MSVKELARRLFRIRFIMVGHVDIEAGDDIEALNKYADIPAEELSRAAWETDPFLMPGDPEEGVDWVERLQTMCFDIEELPENHARKRRKD